MDSVPALQQGRQQQQQQQPQQPRPWPTPALRPHTDDPDSTAQPEPRASRAPSTQLTGGGPEPASTRANSYGLSQETSALQAVSQGATGQCSPGQQPKALAWVAGSFHPVQPQAGTPRQLAASASQAPSTTAPPSAAAEDTAGSHAEQLPEEGSHAASEKTPQQASTIRQEAPATQQPDSSAGQDELPAGSRPHSPAQALGSEGAPAAEHESDAAESVAYSEDWAALEDDDSLPYTAVP